MPTASRIAAAAALCIATALTLACGRAPDRTAQAAPPRTPDLPAFEAGRFLRPSAINNPWMPLAPGTRFVYEGTAVEDDGKKVPHRIVVTVTDLTKVIAGVRTAVTWDQDYNDGELVEAELAFYAQDSTGTVWYLGEYPEEYEDGKFVAARPWIHGLEGASAGIMMPAAPRLGTPSYAEGWGPAVEWSDRGQVDQMGQRTCVPAACYDSALVIAETSSGEPDATQLKYYARGTGNVRVGWRGAGEKTQEVLELARVERLDAQGMAAARAEAKKLEQSGYQRSSSVYAHTPPVEGMASP
ncbi:MAG TPA: hypothetical protein VKB63_09160 [Gemmatimonadales bacterium]|nr:hypothetical protein [Gemmatimonadales bacterium]